MSDTIIHDGAFDRRCVDQDGLFRMRNNPLRGATKAHSMACPPQRRIPL